MPDRDPALEAAANVRAMWTYVYRNHSCLKDEEKGIACGPCLDIDNLMLACEELGRVKALRSLGAGTPEAVAALRELVRATMRMYGEGREHIENVCHCAAHLARAGGEFARLATPTEEGR